jgi:hypothetical protein
MPWVTPSPSHWRRILSAPAIARSEPGDSETGEKSADRPRLRQYGCHEAAHHEQRDGNCKKPPGPTREMAGCSDCETSQYPSDDEKE